MNRPVLVALAWLLLSACDSPKRTSPAPAALSSGAAAPSVVSAALPVAGLEERLEPLRQRTYAIAVDGSLAHVGTEAGVTVFDLERPDEPKAIAHTALPGSVNNLSLIGGARLAVAAGPSGLAIVDVSAARSGKLSQVNAMPWTPTQRGACHSVWKAAWSSGAKAFLACGTGGVAEVDLSVPADPTVKRALACDDYVRDVAVLDGASGVPGPKAAGTLVAAAAGQSGLLVIDFAGVGAPKVVSQVPTPGDTRAIAVRGGHAYLAEGPAGFRIVDLRDPAKPKVVGSLRPDTTDMIRGVAVGPRIAWLCAGESGMLAIDISELSSPRKVGSYDPERAINRAVLLPNRVLAANDADGLLILDDSDIGSPRVVYPKK